ncbi:MAG: hypothetical protein IPH07_39055 [Deltaproteobacteria bacterium]|nr:hypothetical protein [Deltaproteobacteria bacterium]MBK8713831.1 hypothetical protein [Deltaproteobacteria bacterium]MBP7291328.1 hypothetical protein [Nannocystaceae bacterium]
MREAQAITLFDKTIFGFSFLAASGSQTIILERALPVIPFYYLWLGVRCHNRDFGGSSGSMIVEGYTTLPSDEDPAEFTNTAAPNLSVTSNNATAVPSLALATNSAMGPFIKFQLRALQPTGATRCYAELSAVLYGRAP